MSSLLEQISQDLNEALKARDEIVVSTLRFLISGLKNARIAKGNDLTDDEVQAEIVGDARRHKESIESFRAGGRKDLADREGAELAILEKYLPKQFSDEELENMVIEAISAVDAKGASDLGRVVKSVLGSAGVRADGAKVAQIARAKLTPNS